MINFLATILGKLMRWIYDSLAAGSTEPNNISFYAISIIIMTLLVTLITVPVTISQQKQAEQTNRIKPKMDEIQKKYSYDPQIMQQKMQELYKEEGVNPGISSCLMMIFQLLILFALFRVMRDTTTYVFPEGITGIRKDFYWVKDLTQQDPYWFGLPLATSLSQFVVQLFSMKTNPQMSEGPMSQMNTMFLLMPLLYFFMFRQLPAGLPLYYTMSSVIRFIIMVVMHYTVKKPGQARLETVEVKDEKVNRKTGKDKR